MTQETFDIADGIRITATFTDLNGNPGNPSSVIFKLKDPSGSVTLPAAQQSDTGVYYVDIVVDSRGTWFYRWEGDGAIQAAVEGEFFVRASRFS